MYHGDRNICKKKRNEIKLKKITIDQTLNINIIYFIYLFIDVFWLYFLFGKCARTDMYGYVYLYSIVWCERIRQGKARHANDPLYRIVINSIKMKMKMKSLSCYQMLCSVVC